MKANRRVRPIAAIIGALGLGLVTGCVAPPPVAISSPASRVAPLPVPVIPPPPSTGWRDMPITPGTWKWGLEDGQSVARFADGLVVLRCDRAARTVTLLRAGHAADAVPMGIDTTALIRPVTGMPLSAPPAIAVTFAAADPLLDAMAFSRGRFGIEAAGLPTLAVPSWPEVARVIEDCR